MKQSEPTSMLYKYRNFENNHHFDSLKKNRIFFTSPSRFNDPHDCGIPFRFLDAPEEKIRIYLHSISRDIPEFRNANQYIINQFIEQKLAALPTEQADRRAYERRLTSESNESWGIYSMSANWDKILMWSHYSHDHSGFCIGYNTDKLFEFLKNFNGLNKNGFYPDKVIYVKDYPLLTPYDGDGLSIEKLSKSLIYKYIDWAYEEEHRLLGYERANESITIKDDIIDEIILGIKTTEKNMQKVIELLQSKAKKISLYKTIFSDTSFDLTRKKIEY